MAASSCDVLIVGGGPAGSTCAWQLVQAGFDVMVIDKRTFPRDKICAGWITPHVVSSLQLDLDRYCADGRVLQPLYGMHMGLVGSNATATVRYKKAISFGIRRFEFDHYLLERSGARLRLGEQVKTLTREAGGWVVNGEIRTPLVVGAGGHFCPVARALGGEVGQGETIVAAQEIEFRFSRSEDRCAIDNEMVELYFCPDLKGYGWCFVKGDYLNVGLGREDNHKLAQHVEDFCGWLQRRRRIPADLPGKLNGHAYLLFPSSQRKVIDDGVLLIGDAAGLAYPQSGEGIRPAVESGLMAAALVSACGGRYTRADLEPYCDRLDARFGKRTSSQSGPRVSSKVRQKLAGWLLTNEWFARHVVIDRWFLHSSQAPLLAPKPH